MLKISETAKKILNDERLIDHRDMWFQRLQNIFDNRPDEFNEKYVMAIGGVLGMPEDPFLIYKDPERWAVESLENLASMSDRIYNDMMFVPPCIESAIYGVHFIDKIFGAEVWFQDGQWYNRYLNNPVGELRMPDLEHDETWQIARRAALAFLDQGVRLPLFGLPTIASALNIAINLYGENILAEMLMDDEAAKHDFAIINEVLKQIHRWYRSVLPQQQLQPVISWERTQPPGYGQLCGCSLQLISGDLFEEFIQPLDSSLLGVYPHGGMVHLCGRHDQIIPHFREMTNLKSVQINDRAAHDLKRYYEGLRDDQILYLSPCEGMPVDRALEITGGHRLIIQGPIREPVLKPVRP